MSIIIDLIVVVIIAIMALISAKRGFVRVAIETLGFIAAIIVGLTLSTTLADVTYNKLIEPAIVSSVGSVAENATGDSADEVWDSMPDFIKNNADKVGINKDSIKQELTDNIGDSANEMIISISQNTIKPMAVSILKALYSVILILVLLVVVKFLARIVNKMFNVSILGKINNILGGSLGIIKGLIIAWIFCTALSLVISFTTNGIWIFNDSNIEKTYIFKFLTDVIKF